MMTSSKILKMTLSALVLLLLIVGCSKNITPFHSTEENNLTMANMTKRHSNIKAATVRIFVDQRPRGTGFLVSENGLIVTCFHVVSSFHTNSQGITSVRYSSDIKVELSNGQKFDATPIKTEDQIFFKDAYSMDYSVLKIDKIGLPYLSLGKFSDAKEGAAIYISGFPFGIDQPVVAVGMLSTKWKAPSNLGETTRDVAWLDVTMNNGNSGGPVILIDNNLNNDKVIGIATFKLNPYAKRASELAEFARETLSFGSIKLMGINIGKFAELVGVALNANSLGIGGCVSIDYIRDKIF